MATSTFGIGLLLQSGNLLQIIVRQHVDAGEPRPPSHACFEFIVLSVGDGKARPALCVFGVKGGQSNGLNPRRFGNVGRYGKRSGQRSQHPVSVPG